MKLPVNKVVAEPELAIQLAETEFVLFPTDRKVLSR